jgi:hypothetical protein
MVLEEEQRIVPPLIRRASKQSTILLYSTLSTVVRSWSALLFCFVCLFSWFWGAGSHYVARLVGNYPSPCPAQVSLCGLTLATKYLELYEKKNSSDSQVWWQVCDYKLVITALRRITSSRPVWAIEPDPTGGGGEGRWRNRELCK